MVSDQQLADAFFDEWLSIEEFRVEVIGNLLEVCRDMHRIRVALSENMIQILVENPNKEYGVTKDLAEGTAALLRAMRGLERNVTMEQVLTNQLGEEPWDSANGTA
jgi:hypothetical protein